MQNTFQAGKQQWWSRVSHLHKNAKQDTLIDVASITPQEIV